MVDDGFRFAVFADLQVGVLQEIHSVNLMFGSDVHSRGLARRSDGGEVRLNVFLPEAEASKNMRRRVQGMRRSGSDLRVNSGLRRDGWVPP
jgi:hypothetical protein